MSEGFSIRQPAGQRTLALREVYLAICEGDACEAHLLNALERWYTYKLKEREQNRGKNKAARQGNAPANAEEGLWVRMSAESWVTELLGLYNEKTIRLKLGELVNRSFVSTRSNPTRRWDRTPQWLFQRLAVQEAVDLWEAQRPQPDLDPTSADLEAENVASAQPDAHPEAVTETSRTNVRMQPVKVPNGVGQSSESSRTNVRSNNTGILTQESFPDTLNRGVIPLEEDARARPPVTSSRIEARQEDPVPNSSSENASLQNKAAIQEELSAVALLEQPAASPTAADAASDMLALTDQDFNELLGAGDVNDQVLPKVAGGAAAASPTVALQVAALVPVPRIVLAARPVAPVGSEVHQGIKAMVGKHRLDELLGELTMTGGHSRKDWLRLLPDEITLVREAARSEARQQGGSMVTFAARGLDRMIGAVASQKPQQQALQANGAAYTLFEKPVAQVDMLSEGKYEVGARYRPKTGGADVQLMELEMVKSKTAGIGAKYRFSDGQVIGMLELISKFDFVGRDIGREIDQ
ncbi:hypothetical protein EHF33_20850 (plasmid) [Deinococcus psychrotolerans]|uniref:Uncharacterized protein n=1 Tax=Deinococcus psychrotolerans TaxID=2489213 RepID=A0A3G8YJD9_9DEIO|nr:hypothetical protein [Deinococcus psychrotolerans]AZI45362.1 hypothetical protein EHF33_20850 [Deinococcus psychrotolerans]